MFVNRLVNLGSSIRSHQLLFRVVDVAACIYHPTISATCGCIAVDGRYLCNVTISSHCLPGGALLLDKSGSEGGASAAF